MIRDKYPKYIKKSYSSKKKKKKQGGKNEGMNTSVIVLNNKNKV